VESGESMQGLRRAVGMSLTDAFNAKYQRSQVVSVFRGFVRL